MVFPFYASRRRAILLLAVFCALLTAPAAIAWSKTYVTSRWLTPAEYYGTGWAPNIAYNEVAWGGPDGNDAIGMALCHPDSSCYLPVYDYSGFGQDLRSISYGSAWCGGAYFNRWNQFVYSCYADNT